MAAGMKQVMPLAHAPEYPGKAGAGWTVHVVDLDDQALPIILSDQPQASEVSLNEPAEISVLRFGLKVPRVHWGRAARDPLQPHPLELWVVFKNKAYRGLDFRVRLVVPVLPRGSPGM